MADIVVVVIMFGVGIDSPTTSPASFTLSKNFAELSITDLKNAITDSPFSTLIFLLTAFGPPLPVMEKLIACF